MRKPSYNKYKETVETKTGKVVYDYVRKKSFMSFKTIYRFVQKKTLEINPSEEYFFCFLCWISLANYLGNNALSQAVGSIRKIDSIIFQQEYKVVMELWEARNTTLILDIINDLFILVTAPSIKFFLLTAIKMIKKFVK